ncbi:hypothetical protein GW17_00040563 [Ensete ventricosum]|nr:hypothetical protein GW17_00040563 [Ensete ventricosum]
MGHRCYPYAGDAYPCLRAIALASRQRHLMWPLSPLAPLLRTGIGLPIGGRPQALPTLAVLATSCLPARLSPQVVPAGCRPCRKLDHDLAMGGHLSRRPSHPCKGLGCGQPPLQAAWPPLQAASPQVVTPCP